MNQAKQEDAVPLHVFISIAANKTGKTNQEIAEEVGFTRGNVVAMIRSGSMKVPVNRVMSLAKAIDVDPLTLLRKTLGESGGEILDVIQVVTGKNAISDNEALLVDFVRTTSGNLDIDWTSRPEFTDALTPAIKLIRTRETRNATMAIKKRHESDGRFAGQKKS
jgi:hypothetical protein